MFGMIASAATNLGGQLLGYLDKRNQRKRSIDTIRAKTEQARQEGQTHLQLSDAEWETVAQRMSGETWKDEYAVIVMTLPLLTMVFGAIAATFGYPQGLDAFAKMSEAFEQMGIDYGNLLYVTILSALGIRVLRPR